MPELPEVETVKSSLEPHLIGKTIKEVKVLYRNLIDTDDFEKKLVSQKIIKLNRVGKFIIFHLTDKTLISHLRMEGKYFLRENNDIYKHDHVVFKLDNGLNLVYNDVRKFGRFKILSKDKYLNEKPLSNLGPEPKNANVNQIFRILKKKNVSIKTALLDQKVISGLGNIYVDETLFESKIHPLKKTSKLKYFEVKKIIENAIKILEDAINMGGTTIRTYYSTMGIDGKFQNRLKIHTKINQPCLNCKQKIEKIKVSGRGTYVCKNCQK